jgi:hypothetical protein
MTAGMTDIGTNPREEIGRLADLLNVPSTLAGFLRVLSQFRPAWILYREIADPTQKRQVDEVSLVIDRILSGEICLAHYKDIAKVPPLQDAENKVSPSDTRKTLKNYYGPHPLYSIFWHECATRAYEPQYRSLLASALPALVALEQAKAQDKLLQDGAEQVGRALRQLTLKDIASHEKELLYNLPVSAMTPAELLDHIYADLKRQGLEKSVLYGDRIKALIKVLAWSISGEWPRRNLFQKTTSFGGRSSPKHGATSRENVDLASPEQWLMPDGTPAHMTRFLATDGHDISAAGAPPNMDPETDAAERAALVHVTTPPSTRFHRKDRAVAAATKARYAAQAIEMEAQQLPVTRTTLTGWDIKSLLAALENLDAGEWNSLEIDERPSVAAWLAAMVYLGRDDAMIETLQVSESGSSRESIFIQRGNKQICLPVQSPRHEPPPGALDDTIVPESGLTLPAPERLLTVLGRLKPIRRRLFQRPWADEATALLNEINRRHGTHLTPNRVRRFVPNLIRQLAPNDEVYQVYFTGAAPNQHNPAVYSSVPISRLAELYRQAIYYAESIAGQSVDASSPPLPALMSDDLPAIGSRYVPRQAALRRALAAQYEYIESLRGSPKLIEEKHNAFTALLVFVTLALSGVRGTRTSLGLRCDVDRKTSTAFVSEKDDETYTNARVVWIHPVLLELFDEYALHEFRVRQHLALKNPATLALLDARDEIHLLSPRKAPRRSADLSAIDESVTYLYFIGQNAVPQSATLSAAKDYLKGDWKLHLGVLRHFVRTQLLLRCVSGEAINALLGHHERGQNAWGRFSSLPPEAWRAEMRRHLGSIAEELGVKSVRSPVFP